MGGVPLICYCISVPKPIIVMFKFLDFLRVLVLVALSAVGIYRHDQPLQLLEPTSSAVQHPQPSSVKERLPVIEFARFSERSPSPSPSSRKTSHGQEEPACMFCLETMEAGDEVRELGNCFHAFHKDCLDQWVDLGQVTCPLCRSDLLPQKRRGGHWGRVSNFVARIWRSSGIMTTNNRALENN